MKTPIHFLINSLEDLLEVLADRTGIVKYIVTTNALLWGSRGRLERLVLYSRNGEQQIRTRPAHFNIKNPAYWQGRFERFKAAMRLAKCLNHSLADLYETAPAKGTLFNLITSQVLRFWVGGPAPAPYDFVPGSADTEIGNGTMPDARDVLFTPQAGGKLHIAWNTACDFPNEHADDVLQIILIIKNGAFGEWHPMIGATPGPSVKRSDGSCLWNVPKVFLNPDTGLETYIAIKFKSGNESGQQVKGIFKFPAGIVPVTLMP